MIKVGSKVTCTSIFVEAIHGNIHTVVGYEDGAWACIDNVSGGHSGSAYQLRDENGNILEIEPRNGGNQYYYVPIDTLTLVTTHELSNLFIKCILNERK